MNKNLGRFLLLLSTILIFLIIFEFSLIILEKINKGGNRDDIFKEFFQFSDIYGWENKPNTTKKFTIPDTISYVRINNLGFRGEDYKEIENMYKILVLGDSFTWGYGVNDNETYPKLLEIYNSRIKTINMGVAGYGTDQEYLTMINKGLKMKPDLVILMYQISTDTGDTNSEVRYGKIKPLFEYDNRSLFLTNVPLPKRDLNTNIKKEDFIKSLRGYKFFRDNLISIPFIREFLIDNFHIGRDYDFIENYNLVFTILTKLNEELKKEKIPFLVIIMPDKEQINGPLSNRSIYFMENFLEKENINYIDLFPYFKEEDISSIYFKIDGHTNFEGNKKIAKIIYTELMNNKKEYKI